MPFKKEKNREPGGGRRENGSGIIFLSMIFALCLSIFTPCSLLSAETFRDRVVAYTDNTAITLSDLEEKYAETVKVLPDTTKEEVLNTMINRILLIKEANRIKMEAPSEEELLKEYIDLKLRTFIRIRDEDLLDYYNKHTEAFEGKAFDAVREEIENYLVESELNNRLKLHIAELREKACISIRFHKDE
jgi:hypothetical protein